MEIMNKRDILFIAIIKTLRKKYRNEEAGIIKKPIGKKQLFLILMPLILVIPIGFLSARYYSNRVVKFRTSGTSYQIHKFGQWQNFLIKGVNMGAAKPGYFPGEMGITKKDYARWFRYISAMNANAVRVYTILSPDFYEALFEHNMFTRNPLYVFHGVWNNEEAVNELQDAYHPDITGEFKSEIRDLIDLLHGNKIIPPRNGHASGSYMWDVSPYIAGYILGIEQDAAFVIATNEKNQMIQGFNGDYLYTMDASPYESWLAEIGEYAIDYEYRKYKTQKPLSWTNWITTDPLWHISDPDRVKEDAVSVDIEHISAKDSFQPGLFASYHVYPYYPEFMMYDPAYTAYTDKKGKINPYEAYLRDLRSYHSVPVLIAEFGIPSSRGCTHENILTGYNQGFVTEEHAGEYVADMFDSIVASGCCGGLIFSWQDEWSKRSWNTMDYDLGSRRAYWSNAQVSEQCYGILSFDPGDKKSICYVDGDISDWTKTKAITRMNGMELSAMSDEKFVYLLIRDENPGAGKNKYAIAAGSLKDGGNYSFNKEGLKFKNPAGQCIIIDGEDNSAVYVAAYYDVFYRQYSLLSFLNIVEKNKAFEVKNSGIFNPIILDLRRSLDFPLTGVHLEPSLFETGRLQHGNAKPGTENYNSLADFFINPVNRSIELRIPWQLLNVADPSTKTVIGDLYANDQFHINPVQTDGFTFELFRINNSGITEGGSGFFSWEPWEKVHYHERLKESFNIIKSKFSKY